MSGSSVSAGVLRRHLAALGAHVRSDVPEPGGVEPGEVEPGGVEPAASVRLALADGRRRTLRVDWSGPVHEPGLVDEATVQAVCGVMHVHGRRTGRPTGLSVDYCATAAGVVAMSGLLASLLTAADDLTVSTSVAEAALLSVSQYLAAAGADDPEAVDLAPGGPPFTSADGVRFELETLLPETWARFWADLGTPRDAMRASWRPFQFRYATATAPIDPALHHATLAHTFAEIHAAAERAGVSVCRLYPAAEHAAERSAWFGGQPAPPWSIEVGHRRAPAWYPTPPDQPLHGIDVLEAGRRVQAPLAAHLLGMLGARVTRIEPPGGDPLRGMPPCSGGLSARWLALNRGKHAVEIDIKEPADRARLRTLAAAADVFLHNWAPGKAEQLELGARDLPGHLVYAYTSGWGGHPVPDAPIGTDFMVQARTGMADTVRPADTPPAPSLMTLLDVLGGLLGAETVLAGLLTRNATGRGVSVQSGLFGAALELHPPGERHLEARPPTGHRQPTIGGGAPLVGPDDPALGGPVAVTTDLAALVDDPRMADVIGRDRRGAPALCRPWRFS